MPTRHAQATTNNNPTHDWAELFINQCNVVMLLVHVLQPSACHHAVSVIRTALAASQSTRKEGLRRRRTIVETAVAKFSGWDMSSAEEALRRAQQERNEAAAKRVKESIPLYNPRGYVHRNCRHSGGVPIVS